MTCSKTKLYKAVVKRLKAKGYEGDCLDDVKKNLIIAYKALKFPYMDFNNTHIAAAMVWAKTPQGWDYWFSVSEKISGNT